MASWSLNVTVWVLQNVKLSRKDRRNIEVGHTNEKKNTNTRLYTLALVPIHTRTPIHMLHNNVNILQDGQRHCFL